MGFIFTLLMGLIIGSIAGFLMKTSYPWYLDMILGIIGSAVGGWLSSLFFGVDLTGGFNLTSLITAVIGAVIVIAIVRFFSGRR